MIISDTEITTIANAIPKIIGVVEDARLLGNPQGVVADFVSAHPDEVTLIEKLANFFFPGAGTGIEILIFIVEYSHKMSDEEEAIWMNRQGSEP